MANSSYKPLWGNDGNLIITTSTVAPKPGDPNKLYYFTDQEWFAIWKSNEYHYLKEPAPPTYVYPTKDDLPMPGEPGVKYYVEQDEAEYVWLPTSGNQVIRFPNWDGYTNHSGQASLIVNKLVIHQIWELRQAVYTDAGGEYLGLTQYLRAPGSPKHFEGKIVNPIVGGQPIYKQYNFADCQIVYYDPDDPPLHPEYSPDYAPSTDLMVIYVPKTYNLNKWQGRLLNFVLQGAYNYTFLVSGVKGSYVKIK